MVTDTLRRGCHRFIGAQLPLLIYGIKYPECSALKGWSSTSNPPTGSNTKRGNVSDSLVNPLVPAFRDAVRLMSSVLLRAAAYERVRCRTRLQCFRRFRRYCDGDGGHPLQEYRRRFFSDCDCQDRHCVKLSHSHDCSAVIALCLHCSYLLIVRSPVAGECPGYFNFTYPSSCLALKLM